MKLSRPLYALYSRSLRRQVASGPLPRHVGLIMDGNRRWARQAGLASPSLGHQYGADHIDEVLAWCEPLNIKHVTVFVCSTENLTGRGSEEVAFLMQVIEKLAAKHLARPDARWQLHVAAGGSYGAPIYASIDDDPTLDQYKQQVVPYLKAWESVLGRQRVGVYANSKTIDWALQDGIGSYFWQHNWGSPKGFTHPAAHLHQVEIDKQSVGGVGVDINHVLKPQFGQWD